MNTVVAVFRVVYAQEDKMAVRKKERVACTKLREMKLKGAADKLDARIKETLTYTNFPREHWPSFSVIMPSRG